ncbi:MAG: hypothetical protein WC551_00995 [Patescibacteria group bacterium]
MSSKSKDASSDGVMVHLENIRLDKGAEQRKPGRYLQEEPPTKPGVPKAKKVTASTKCEHGLRLADCVECALRAEVVGCYSIVGREADPCDKKGE